MGRWGGGGGWLLKDIRLKWSDLTFSLVCILESTFIPTPIIYLGCSGYQDGCCHWTTPGICKQRRHSQKFALIKASTISMLMLPVRVKACLANQRFQENDVLRPDWRLVLVHQAIPKRPFYRR